MCNKQTDGQSERKLAAVTWSIIVPLCWLVIESNSKIQTSTTTCTNNRKTYMLTIWSRQHSKGSNLSKQWCPLNVACTFWYAIKYFLLTYYVTQSSLQQATVRHYAYMLILIHFHNPVKNVMHTNLTDLDGRYQIILKILSTGCLKDYPSKKISCKFIHNF